MNLNEIKRILEIVNVEPQIIELVEFAYYRGAKYEEPAPYLFLTASEIVDCFTAVYQCDSNDVSENDIKFARHIERLTLER
jgi:hypothetical protein